LYSSRMVLNWDVLVLVPLQFVKLYVAVSILEKHYGQLVQKWQQFCTQTKHTQTCSCRFSSKPSLWNWCLCCWCENSFPCVEGTSWFPSLLLLTWWWALEHPILSDCVKRA
jgi:hypothetical protein